MFPTLIKYPKILHKSFLGTYHFLSKKKNTGGKELNGTPSRDNIHQLSRTYLESMEFIVFFFACETNFPSVKLYSNS